MPKDNIRENLDGNELDLSLNNLSVVPVKELAGIPKATHLDLSCNVLTSLPDNFCNLQHLVKIDLSKNTLTSLPTRFGNLSNLQHLDLLGNQLKSLPLSFCHLQRLKWLDLKDNPLEPNLKKAAGDCLNETECRQCAKNMLVYMKNANSEAERQKQKRLQETRDKEAAEKKKEEEEQKKKKAEKKAEKERRRLQHLAQRDLQKKEKPEEIIEEADEVEHRNGPSKRKERVQKKSCFWSCCLWFVTLFALFLAAVVGAEYFCKENQDQDYCAHYYKPARNVTVEHFNYTKSQISVFLQAKFGVNPVSDFLIGKVRNGTA